MIFFTDHSNHDFYMFDKYGSIISISTVLYSLSVRLCCEKLLQNNISNLNIFQFSLFK